MKNNKGFTMIELIIVVVIIGVILVFAIPNLVSTLERNKGEAMYVDAEQFIEQTKNCIVANRRVSATKRCEYPTSGSIDYYLSEVDSKSAIKESPYGNVYNRTESKVTVKYEDGQYKYSVELKDNDGNVCKVNYGEDKCS